MRRAVSASEVVRVAHELQLVVAFDDRAEEAHLADVMLVTEPHHAVLPQPISALNSRPTVASVAAVRERSAAQTVEDASDALGAVDLCEQPDQPGHLSVWIAREPAVRIVEIRKLGARQHHRAHPGRIALFHGPDKALNQSLPGPRSAGQPRNHRQSYTKAAEGLVERE